MVDKVTRTGSLVGGDFGEELSEEVEKIAGLLLFIYFSFDGFDSNFQGEWSQR